MAKNKANKRSNGDGSVRQRKDGTWEARFTVGINPGTGKPIRKSIYGKTKSEVAEKLRTATSSVDDGTYFAPEKITVKQWFETWLSEYMAGVKPLTVQQYRSMTETHIIPALGAVKLSKLTAPQLQKFYNQLAVDGMTTRRKNKETGKMEIVKKTEKRENPETGKIETIYFPLSPKTIQNIHDIISKALNTAISSGLIKDNVSARCTLPKVIKKEVVPLSEEKQLEFIKAIEDHKYKNLYFVYLFCGLRESEAIGLTWNCIDFKKGTMKIYRQWQRTPGEWGTFRFETLKNDKSRTIALSPFVLSVLMDQQKKQRVEKLAAGEFWQGFDTLKEQETAFVFTDRIGKPLNPAPVYENFKKIVAGLGVPTAYVHTLRHTAATNALAEGDSPKTVQENLGHHSAAFTLDVYGHVSEKMREESASRQQAMIERMGLKNA
ncbi:MAG: site-specific integrase [Oscillospiraceae bacterium]|nr:site-specific integrase [Oscillospiraceae bacterium]